jgi:hypothetical protein
MIPALLTVLALAAGTPHDASTDAVEYTPVDEPAHIVSGYNPVYPPSLVDVDLFPTVTVTMAVYIDRTGKPIKMLDVTKVNLPGEFVCAAEQAVEKSVWTPAQWGGYMVGSWIIYEIHFVNPKYGPKKEMDKKGDK